MHTDRQLQNGQVKIMYRVMIHTSSIEMVKLHQK